MQFSALKRWIQSFSCCILCSESLGRMNNDRAPYLCPICAVDLKFLPYGLDIQSTSAAESLDCPELDGLAAVSLYQWPMSSWIRALKFNQKQLYASVIGFYMARQLEQLEWPTFDFICPIPLHFWRHHRRGFNQSLVLMEALNTDFSIPVYTGLIRTRYTRSQSSLNRVQRLKNLNRVFKSERPILNCTCLIIDDVITTGTTINEAAKALKNAGATRVYALCGAIRIMT